MCNTEYGREPLTWYFRRRSGNLLRRLRRRLGIRRAWEQPFDSVEAERPAPGPIELNAGDRVRVRPLAEIKATLSPAGACGGCAFLEPMAKYCGQEFRVARRLDHFFDERRWRMLKCRNTVLLEGVHCDGAGHPDTRGCDRMCFFFWRTEWLERLGE